VADRAARKAVEWCVATRCRRGEATSGDLGVVSLLPDGALVAAIDGLGHGGAAALAAGRAAAVLRERPGRDLVELFERCHVALQGTRGAAISLAFVSPAEDTMTWVGVGNVEGRVVSGDPSATRVKGSLALGSGIPGHQLPKVRATTINVRPGDVLVLATDGIEAAFGDSLDTSGPTQAITDRVLAAHWKPSDDALVVAVRYLGVRP
jgi:phosphoserine phosphatase RsbX